LATQFTSFVAVEEKTVVQDGKPVRIEVPVELPAGVSPLAVPGELLSVKSELGRNGTGGGIGAGSAVGFDAGTYRIPQPSATPSSNAVTETVEVTSTAPMVEKDSSQLKHTYSGLGSLPGAPSNDGPPTSGGGTPEYARRLNHWTSTLKVVQPKFSADLLAYYQCASIGSTPDGKACAPQASNSVKVQVELTAANATVERKLALAGFKVESGKGTTQLLGTILTHRLKQLAQIVEVKSVSLSK
jgi:hypothetical protein